MYEIQINERGQVTIPKKIRDALGIHPNDSLKVDVNEQNQIVLFKKDVFRDIDDLLRKELQNSGVPEKEIEQKLQEKKIELANQLLHQSTKKK